MYTVKLTTESPFFHATCETLAEAAFLKKAWEVNQPLVKGEVVVFDQYDYLVPSTELAIGLEIKRNEVLNNLRILNG